MKAIATSKGEFVVVDVVNSIDEAYQDGDAFYKLICKLSEATEEDASDVVDEPLFDRFYKCYTDEWHFNTYSGEYCFDSSIDSLHSLLKSNNITGDNLYIFKKICFSPSKT